MRNSVRGRVGLSFSRIFGMNRLPGLLLLVLYLSLCSRLTPAGQRPNVVFLMADDLCSRSVACYGGPGVKTPHLDRLASDGMKFMRHYDTTAICMASRANVMTGMFEFKTGCNFGTGPLRAEHWERAYPVLLRKAGYVTAFAGKFGFVVAAGTARKGKLPKEDFDQWGGGPGQTHYATARNVSMSDYAAEYPHSTRAYGAFGADFIARVAKGSKPFCLSISFKAPHRPVSPDPKFDKVYRGATFVKPANFGRQHGDHFSAQSRMGRQYDRFHSWKYSTDYDTVMAKYNQQVFAIDAAVGMIRTALSKSGVAGNTVVIFTSDNGFLCGAHGYGSKVLPYEESSCVPLIMFDPRQREPQGRTCDALTGNVDIAPTLLELAGVTIPANMDGRSLNGLYRDPKSSTHSALPLINVWGPKPTHCLSVVTLRWKFIRWPFSSETMAAAEELYDMREDRLELHNLVLSAEHINAVTELRKRYDAVVSQWTNEGVAYHGYPALGRVFVRSRTP